MAVTDPKFNPSEDPVIDGIKRRVVELEEFATSRIEGSRRLSVALTQLETASMWLVKAAAVGDE